MAQCGGHIENVIYRWQQEPEGHEVTVTIYRDVGEKKLKRAFAFQYRLKLILRGEQIRTGHNVQGVRFSISVHNVQGVTAMRSLELPPAAP